MSDTGCPRSGENARPETVEVTAAVGDEIVVGGAAMLTLLAAAGGELLFAVSLPGGKL